MSLFAAAIVTVPQYKGGRFLFDLILYFFSSIIILYYFSSILLSMLVLWLLSTVALALEPLCNPLKDPGCIARNSALGADVFATFSHVSPEFEATMQSPNVQFDAQGAHLSINQRFDNPQVFSSKYILYGKVEAEVQAALGRSVISSMYMQSDDLDEIDIGEYFGGNGHVFQTNYFVKGNVSNYERDTYHYLHPPVTQNYHRFGLEWTPQSMTWSVDGAIVRLVTQDSPHGFPQSPMRLIFSLWAGGDPSNDKGTIDWAGGPADYSQLPYTMHVRNVHLVDYSLGNEYVYGSGRQLHAANGRIYGFDNGGSESEEMLPARRIAHRIWSHRRDQFPQNQSVGINGSSIDEDVKFSQGDVDASSGCVHSVGGIVVMAWALVVVVVTAGMVV